MINFLSETILKAGKLALEWFDKRELIEIGYKGPKDLVTAADLDVERLIEKSLLDKFPEFGFFGEGKRIPRGQ